ncbi:MAG TPA: phosphatase PAP2 family protein [Mucilaginibacter sp.]|nr:phosphatase PAP2 family protein [Mucilaginibacter sp.]
MESSLNDVLRKIKWLVVPYMAVLIICLCIKLAFTKSEIYFAVNGLYSPLADAIAPYVTDLGNGWIAVAIALIMLLFFSYRKALIVASSFAITSLLGAQFTKYIFDAPRPKLYFQDQVKHLRFVKGIEILNYHSFPSGHTVTAFMLAVLLTYWSRNRAWGPVFLLIAILVGYSRMYLSEHFFEDVVAGSVIGFVLTTLWLWWLDSRKFIQRPGWQKGLLNRG